MESARGGALPLPFALDIYHICFCSADPHVLAEWIRDRSAGAAVDYFRRVDLNQPALAVNEVQATGASLIGVNKDLLTPPLIAEAHRRGLKVEVWTVDNPDEMSKFIDLNVDGITTNRPDLLKSLLAFDPFVTRVTLVPEWLHRFRL